MRHSAMILIVVSATLFGARSARADHEIGLFFTAMGAAMLVPIGAGVLVSPLYIASAVRGTQTARRPTAGLTRLQLVFPPPDPGRATRVHLDLGGYPSSTATVGWEARADVMVPDGPIAATVLQVRWDGLLLFDLGSDSSRLSVEALLGGTAWPTIGQTTRWDWRGGVTGGIRLGRRGAWSILDVEALHTTLIGGLMGTQGSQLELGATGELSIGAPPKGSLRAPASVGIAYRTLFPLGASPDAIRADVFLLSATF